MFESNYEKIKLLGEGAFGAAYLVRSKDASRTFQVCKEVRTTHLNEQQREGALAESRVLRAMSHSNVIAYVASFLEGARLFIIMEYADNGDLAMKIKEHKEQQLHVREQEVMFIFVQMSLALLHVHSRKVLHRDLKPLNVFLTKKGIVKLGDFGIAKVMDSTTAGAQTTIGTPFYLSPEICNSEKYGLKSDLWSLGVVGYELTVLRVPFQAPSLPAVAMKICGADPDPIPDRYSQDLRWIILELLQKEPRKRPALEKILKMPFVQESIRGLLQVTQDTNTGGCLEMIEASRGRVPVVDSSKQQAQQQLQHPRPAASPRRQEDQRRGAELVRLPPESDPSIPRHQRALAAAELEKRQRQAYVERAAAERTAAKRAAAEQAVAQATIQQEFDDRQRRAFEIKQRVENHARAPAVHALPGHHGEVEPDQDFPVGPIRAGRIPARSALPSDGERRKAEVKRRAQADREEQERLRLADLDRARREQQEALRVMERRMLQQGAPSGPASGAHSPKTHERPRARTVPVDEVRSNVSAGSGSDEVRSDIDVEAGPPLPRSRPEVEAKQLECRQSGAEELDSGFGISIAFTDKVKPKPKLSSQTARTRVLSDVGARVLSDAGADIANATGVPNRGHGAASRAPGRPQNRRFTADAPAASGARSEPTNGVGVPRLANGKPAARASGAPSRWMREQRQSAEPEASPGPAEPSRMGGALSPDCEVQLLQDALAGALSVEGEGGGSGIPEEMPAADTLPRGYFGRTPSPEIPTILEVDTQAFHGAEVFEIDTSDWRKSRTRDLRSGTQDLDERDSAAPVGIAPVPESQLRDSGVTEISVRSDLELSQTLGMTGTLDMTQLSPSRNRPRGAASGEDDDAAILSYSASGA